MCTYYQLFHHWIQWACEKERIGNLDEFIQQTNEDESERVEVKSRNEIKKVTI